MLEKQVEKKVCDYAKTKGFITYKFTSPGRASVPDRLLVGQVGDMFFIEFKRPGGKTTAAQDREIARLRNREVAVFVVDSVERGKELVDLCKMGMDMVWIMTKEMMENATT